MMARVQYIIFSQYTLFKPKFIFKELQIQKEQKCMITKNWHTNKKAKQFYKTSFLMLKLTKYQFCQIAKCQMAFL